MNVLDSLFARLYDPMMKRADAVGMQQRRRHLLEGLTGDVLEIGAGTGLNLVAYPPGITLTLTEPVEPMRRRLAQRVTEQWPAAVVVDAAAERLPFEDHSFDAVVSTLVLCSVRDLGRAVAEIRRVVRPGGQVVVFEHVRARGRVATAQRVFEPVQKVLARNCHLTRDMRIALAAGGFDVSRIMDSTFPGPPIVRAMHEGIAVAPA